MATIKLGHKVRDKVTGFTGIAISRNEWLIGCTRIGVKPQGLHEGKTIELEWFDEPQLEDLGDAGLEIETANITETAAPTKPGGPRPDPRSSRD